MSSCNTLKAPSYRLHRPSGQAVVTLGGRDTYLGVYGTQASRETYDRVIAEWLPSGRRTVAGRAAAYALTNSELAAAYWRHAESYYRKDGRPTVEIAKLRVILKPLRHLFGRTAAAEFGPLRLKAIRNGLVASGKSRRYINDQIGRLKRMFRWGVENELIPATVYQALCAVAGLRKGRSDARETAPIKPVPESQIQAVQSFVSRQVWAMIQLQQLTGMRPGEVAIMRRCDLDTSGDIWLYKPASHKTEHFGRDRIVDLGPQAQAVLKRFLNPTWARTCSHQPTPSWRRLRRNVGSGRARFSRVSETAPSGIRSGSQVIGTPQIRIAVRSSVPAP